MLLGEEGGFIVGPVIVLHTVTGLLLALARRPGLLK